ncbi:hypothetical protein [Pleomorphovibrio marinus]|uniref:hypothetical protein n=1 Tax=Pleomorphovibrio marinus TaxID=2164132 RepID=UPI000E0CA88B|nr:hypothetical protein [Pleomorphovibrio marinus]
MKVIFPYLNIASAEESPEDISNVESHQKVNFPEDSSYTEVTSRSIILLSPAAPLAHGFQWLP